MGRFILMYLTDPASVLRSVATLVRPGGVVAFQEPWWAPCLLQFQHLPLWSAGLALSHEVFRRSGANTDIGIALRKIFRDAGLPAPSMHMEMLLGDDPQFTSWVGDILRSMQPQIEQHHLSVGEVGDLATLSARIHKEVETSGSVVGWPPAIGAWSRL